MSQANTRILITDDHRMVRTGLTKILEKNEGFEVVGEAADTDSAIEAVGELDPDVLVLDLGLPGKSGIEAIYELRNRGFKTKILVLTMYDDESRLRHALGAGADGYWLKNSSAQSLFEAIEKVNAGDLVLPEKFESMRSELNDLRAGRGGSTSAYSDPLQKLSKREREVFYLLADGLPNRVIAKKLFISPRTVETHRARVIKKLGFKSTADLIRYAIRYELLAL